MKCKNDNLNIVCVIAFFMIVQTIHGLRSNFSAGNNMTAYTPEKIDKEINIVNHQIDNFVKKITITRKTNVDNPITPKIEAFY